MTQGVKVRIYLFVLLSVLGVVYISAGYLGLVDKALGRGMTVHATLPDSGGLYEGSEVTYRGVKVGTVTDMQATKDGVLLDLSLEEGTELPEDSAIYVHNLSAVGEQYLDFEPADDDPPYADEGYTFRGDEDSVPVGEDQLLIDLDQFVSSVDQENLALVVEELGLLFRDTGRPLQKLLDSGSTFVSEAAAHTEETIALLNFGREVLQTQQANGENIQAFSRNLRLLTRALAQSDPDLREVLASTPGAAKEIQALLDDLGPTLPTLMGNLVTVNQVVVHHLDGIETLLVEFPLAVAAGFTGTPGGDDKFGHVNLQMTQDPPPCSGEGYLPRSRWRSGHDLSDGPIYPAECLKGVPYNQRGSKYSPGARYMGAARSMFAGGEEPTQVHAPANLSVLGDDSWKWLLVGPVSD
jgi:phospholipid/cholesterol/gamma-HCH transport system substrate-binding protein